MQTFILIATIVLIISAIVTFVLILSLYKRGSSVEQNTEQAARGRLARAVTTWALAAIALLGAVIVISSGIYAISVGHNPAADLNAREKATQFFVTTSQHVLGTLLPVVAAWVGTVLAFYFGRENYEAAAKSASTLVRQLTPQERLQAQQARNVMLKLHEITYFRMQPGTQESNVSLKKLITEGFEKDAARPRNRLPILDAEGRPKYVLHRSTLDGFIAPRRNPSAQPPVSEETLTLGQLAIDPQYRQTMQTSFFTIAETTSLADAKTILDSNPACLDLIVTQDGTKQSVAVGWITNVIILNEAIL